MSFSDSFIQELSDRNDIVSVVSEYVSLSKRSGTNLFGLCPFHNEKTPSFSVNEEKRIYHCFGCGKGGGVISFVMEIENLGFRDAVEVLAKRAGIPIPDGEYDAMSERRERMLALNRDSARYFHDCLKNTSVGKIALDYVAERGISPLTQKTFGLGFAPDSWDSLIKSMAAQGYCEAELIDAGLARRGRDGRGAYDTFRNRLMFPVIDTRGNVIGFSGRILSDGEPKYMNSPETLVFHKSGNLFAINLAKKTKYGYIILTEGNIDVIALHQAGFDCAVASLGTSLTAEQARLISRYKKEVVIAYDNDEAGRKASERAIGILEKLDLRVRVLASSGAKDPDEFIRQKGADAFRNLIERSENHIEYRLGTIKKGLNLETDEGRVAFLRESIKLLSEIKNPVEREVYAHSVADTAKISHSAVESETRRLRKKTAQEAKKKAEGRDSYPLRAAQPAQKSLRYDDPAISLAEEGVIGLLFFDPGFFNNDNLPSPEEFSNELLSRFYSELKKRAAQKCQISIDALSGEFTSAEISELTRIISKPISYENSKDAFSDYIKKIRSNIKKDAKDIDLREFAKNRLKETKGLGG